MKRWISAAVLLGAACAAWAQANEGDVLKVDKAQGRLTLRHGGLKNLDMPPMTMVFRVKDPKVLDTLAAGDRVKFDAAKVDGNYTVIAISKTP